MMLEGNEMDRVAAASEEMLQLLSEVDTLHEVGTANDEMARLMMEVDAELMLPSAAPPAEEGNDQLSASALRQQPGASTSAPAASNTRSARTRRSTASAQLPPQSLPAATPGAAPDASLQLAVAPSIPLPPTLPDLPTLLPVTSPSNAVASRSTALALGASADKARRRRANWQRTPTAAVEQATVQKYDTNASSTLGLFMSSLDNTKLLGAEEEQQLAVAAQDYLRLQEMSRITSNVLKRPHTMAELAQAVRTEESLLRERLEVGRSARNILAKRNYRLVVSIARRFANPATADPSTVTAASGPGGSLGMGRGARGTGANLEDVVAAGMEGLLTAIRKFKPGAGFRLSTYATWWIRLSCARFVRTHESVLGVPEYVHDDMYKVDRAIAQLSRQYPHRVFSAEELAPVAGLSAWKVQRVQEVRAAVAGQRSLETGGGNEEDGADLASVLNSDLLKGEDDAGSVVASIAGLDSEEAVVLSDMTATVDDLLSSLDERDEAVIRARFELDTGGGSSSSAAAAAGGGGGRGGSSSADDWQSAAGKAALAAAAALVDPSMAAEGQEAGAPDALAGLLPGSTAAAKGRAGGPKKGAKADPKHAPRLDKALDRLRQRLAERTEDASDGVGRKLAELTEVKSTSKAALPARTPGYAKKSH